MNGMFFSVLGLGFVLALFSNVLVVQGRLAAAAICAGSALLLSAYVALTGSFVVVVSAFNLPLLIGSQIIFGAALGLIAATFAQRVRSEAAFFRKVMELRSELHSSNPQRALLLLLDCFGLSRGESAEILRNLQRRRRIGH